MIHIGEDWYIGGDPLNIILKQRKVAKETGKEYFVDVAFPRTFEQLMNSLSARKAKMSIENMELLKELVELERQIKSDNAEFYQRFENEIKQIVKQGESEATE